MTGPEHYQQAHRELGRAARAGEDAVGYHLALAQVHATLALAAASALNDAEHGSTQEDRDAWRQVAGTLRDSESRRTP